MGVHAWKHAQQLILDLAPQGRKSDLSPRAQLLLLHIAMKTGEDAVEFRDVTKGKVWDYTSPYYEGLGRKGRAIGYNVPLRIEGAAGSPWANIEEKDYNAVKYAVGQATRELITKKLLVLTTRAQTGRTATYDPRFLRLGCSICTVLDKNGQKAMDQARHLSEKTLGDEWERIDEARRSTQGGGVPDTEWGTWKG